MFVAFLPSLSRDAQRDFSIDMEAEEEWEAVSLNPNQPLLTQKVFHSLTRFTSPSASQRYINVPEFCDCELMACCLSRQVSSGVLACRRWLRGRSLYFSRLLTSRTRSRYFFLAYLFAIHMLVLMCLSGAL